MPIDAGLALRRNDKGGPNITTSSWSQQSTPNETRLGNSKQKCAASAVQPQPANVSPVGQSAENHVHSWLFIF